MKRGIIIFTGVKAWIFTYGICMIWAGSCAAQAIAPEAKRVQAAYTVYRKQPNASANHLAFISAFPATKEAFMDVFNDPAFNELYRESTDYVDLYVQLSRDYPTQALPKALAIGSKLVYSDWQAAGMQEALMYLAAHHTDSFAAHVKKLPRKERPGVAIFLADRDTPSAAYDMLVSNLQAAGEARLAAMFVQARNERQKRKQIE